MKKKMKPKSVVLARSTFLRQTIKLAASVFYKK